MLPLRALGLDYVTSSHLHSHLQADPVSIMREIGAARPEQEVRIYKM
jgi:hypothetical protein